MTREEYIQKKDEAVKETFRKHGIPEWQFPKFATAIQIVTEATLLAGLNDAETIEVFKMMLELLEIIRELQKEFQASQPVIPKDVTFAPSTGTVN